MNAVIAAMLAFAAGMALGVFFFYGLHVTVNRIARSRAPGLLTAVSFFLRVGAAAFVFYLFARNGQLIPVIACLAGFLAARFVLVKRLALRSSRGSTAVDTNRGSRP